MRTEISNMIFLSIGAAFQIIFSEFFFLVLKWCAKLATVLPKNYDRMFMCLINKSSII